MLSAERNINYSANKTKYHQYLKTYTNINILGSFWIWWGSTLRKKRRDFGLNWTRNNSINYQWIESNRKTCYIRRIKKHEVDLTMELNVESMESIRVLIFNVTPKWSNKLNMKMGTNIHTKLIEYNNIGDQLSISSFPYQVHGWLLAVASRHSLLQIY